MNYTTRLQDGGIGLPDQLKIALHVRLANLDDRERVAIFLRHWRSYSIAEIAAHLKVNWERANDILETAYSTLRSDRYLRGAVALFTIKLPTELSTEEANL